MSDSWIRTEGSVLTELSSSTLTFVVAVALEGSWDYKKKKSAELLHDNDLCTYLTSGWLR